VDKDKKLPLAIIQEGILGKGKIINTYCYSIFRSKEDAFIENIVVNLYGKKEKISQREIITKKIGIEKENEYEKGYRVVYAKRTETPPEIDGKRDKIWESANWVELVESKEGKKPRKKTEVGILYDDKNLYVFYKCEEPNLSNLKTTTSLRDGEVWNDDCVELFLKTDKNLFHFIVNANGVRYDAKDQNSFWNPDYKVATGRDNNFWTAEFKMPFDIFEIDPKKVPVLKVGLCREEQQLKELSSFLPAPKGFYDPNSWGYLSFVSENEFLSYIKETEKAKKKSLYKEGYLIWYDNPYKRKFSDTLPEKFEELKSLKILLAKKEKECTNLLITNFTDEGLIFRIEPSPEGIKDSKGNSYPFFQIVTLKEAIPRLNPYKEKQMDPLVKLNEGNLITIPPYETRQVWIDVYGNLPPEKYKTYISFVPVNNLWKEKKIEVEIEIVNFEFPEKLPIFGYTFGPYDMTWAKDKRENYFKICPKYHISHVHLYFPLGAIKKDENGNIYVSNDKNDYFRKIRDENGKEVIEEKVALKYADGWFYSYGIYYEFNRRLVALGVAQKKDGKVYFEVEIPEKEWERIFKKWVSTWFKFLKEEKIDFKKFYVPLLDEPQDFVADKLLKVGVILKEINPEVQLTLNPATWTGFELIKKLNPVIDLWMPWEVRLTERGDISKQELEFYQKQARSFCTYLCSPGGISLPLIPYYRLRGIRAYLMDSKGICLWNFNAWRGNDWNEFDEKGIDYHLFYHGDSGPIPSIRAEAFREGFEDYFLIISAEKKLKEKRNEEISRLISKDYLEAINKKQDPEEILKWREKLLYFLSS